MGLEQLVVGIDVGASKTDVAVVTLSGDMVGRGPGEEVLARVGAALE